jgi:hypothetical protein
MSVVTCKKTRRQFLVGAGNTLLALPFLPSLVAQTAAAQTMSAQRKLMVFWFDHNTMLEYWPNRSIATTPIGSSGARETLLKNLPNAEALSPLMTHSLLDSLRREDKITMIRGFEMLGGGGHGYWPVGGNVVFNSKYEIEENPENFPTFDTFIESSRSVYPTSTPSTVRKALRVSIQHGQTTAYQKIGNILQPLPAYGAFEQDFDWNTQRRSTYSLVVMYNDLFGSMTNGTTLPQDNTNQLKTNILNRVFGSFQAFRSNRKISSSDIARVDQHLGYLSDLQRRFAATQPPATLSCTRPSTPSATLTDPVVFTPIYLSMLALAFKCGLTKFGSLYFDSHDPKWLPGLSLGDAPDFHAGIHGSHGTALRNSTYRIYNKWGLDQIATHFLTPLNEMEGNTGRTYLDNMATVILSQAGYESANGGSSHTSYDMHQIILGSMSGAIRAGRYVSFPEVQGRLLPYNTFMITLLQLMGVPESEYSVHATGGRGFGKYVSSTGNPYASRFYTPVSEILTGS